MKRLIRLICAAGLLCMASGCESGGDEARIVSRSAVDGPFELIVELEQVDAHTVLITRKLRYEGDRDIEIRHSRPLISVSVKSGESGESKESSELKLIHVFDNIGLRTAIKADGTVTDGEPMEVKATRGESFVSALAMFTCDGTDYSIPLEFEY